MGCGVRCDTSDDPEDSSTKRAALLFIAASSSSFAISRVQPHVLIFVRTKTGEGLRHNLVANDRIS
jgi:hypothetical protein